jgi:mono/diheme cytochrome c family protein
VAAAPCFRLGAEKTLRIAPFMTSPYMKILSCPSRAAFGRAVVALGTVALCIVAAAAAARAEEPSVTFNRHIRPILAENCYACHGPDKNKRDSDLRLDKQENALADLGGHAAIVPGKPEASELLKRITTDDDTERMPPPSTGKQLTRVQVDLLRRWIAQGAKWQDHWSYLPVERPAVPKVEASAASTSSGAPSSVRPIDAFIRAQLRELGMRPSSPADRVTLVRRLSLDLIGLPPTPAEVDAFLSDTGAGAYERLVDRLLASPHYGERMAMWWLDQVRYADTVGYHGDQDQSAWPYRDYVIRAFNDNLPFDRFTIEQLAGDLLPDATLDQRVAAAYNRLNMMSAEGGGQDKEYHAKYASDRVRTTSVTWLGATLGCCECHDHKFDPFTTRDFYSFAAYFADVQEEGIYRGAVGEKDWSPLMRVPTPEETGELARLERQIAATEAVLTRGTPELEQAQRAWEKSLAANLRWQPIEPVKVSSASGAKFMIRDDRSILVTGDKPATDTYTVVCRVPMSGITAFMLEALPDDSLPNKGPGRAPNGNFVLTEIVIAEKPASVVAAADGQPSEAAAAASQDVSARPIALQNATASFQQRTENETPPTARFAAVRAIDNDAQGTQSGWAVAGNTSKPSVAVFETKVDTTAAATPSTTGPTKAVPSTGGAKAGGAEKAAAKNAGAKRRKRRTAKGSTAEGRAKAGGAALAPGDGQIIVTLKHEYGGDHTLGHFRLWATTAPRPVRAGDADMALLSDKIREALKTPQAERSDAQRNELAAYYRTLAPELAPQRAEVARLKDARKKLEESIPEVLATVSVEPRLVRILPRGNWMDDSGEIVTPAPPKFLPQKPVEGRRATRLDLARWIVSRENPLASRVVVNRLWKLYFGAGLSKRLDDLGSQGDWPSHPELLDWLAVELQESGWNIKHVVRLMVLSDTYRQSSDATAELLQRDPANRWLARQGRFRLDAELVRDNALAASGLLSRKIGGPSVKPYQPAGYWSHLNFPVREWKNDHGEDLYRRGLYTHWQRQYLQPALLAFDAPTREECTVERVRSNTPLQALVLLNDPEYVEAARALAQAAMARGGATLQQRIAWAWRQVLLRPVRPRESEVLMRMYEKHLAEYQKDAAAAEALLKIGEYPTPADINHTDLAAWTSVARAILNLHETVTRN